MRKEHKSEMHESTYQGEEVPDDLRVGDVDPSSQLAHCNLGAVVELKGGEGARALTRSEGKKEGQNGHEPRRNIEVSRPQKGITVHRA